MVAIGRDEGLGRNKHGLVKEGIENKAEMMKSIVEKYFQAVFALSLLTIYLLTYMRFCFFIVYFFQLENFGCWGRKSPIIIV